MELFKAINHRQKQPSRSVPAPRKIGSCSKFTGEHSCQSAITLKLLDNVIEIILWHVCSPINLVHIFRTTFS